MKTTLYILLFALLYSASMTGQDTDQLAPDWRENYTLIFIKNPDLVDFNQLRLDIISEGGAVAIMSRPGIMLGWISTETEKNIKAIHPDLEVFRKSLDPTMLGIKNENNLQAVQFFNYVVSGESKANELKGFEGKGDATPLSRCAEYISGYDTLKLKENLDRFGLSMSGKGTSDYMTGTVTVCLFFVESNGTIDPNQYNWSAADETATEYRTLDGLSWWAYMASFYGESVSFNVYLYSATHQYCRQGYEPILHPSTDDQNWINAIMANMGFTSGNKFERVESFNEWLRDQFSSDYAYSVFIGYNPEGAPTTFTNGRFAYAYIGGPYTHLLYCNDGWGVENFGLVLAHETGHIFYACDEYYQEGYGGCTSCDACVSAPGRTIDNSNCEYCNPNAVSCMMRDNAYTLCPYTPLQIGWQQETWVQFDYSGGQHGTFNQPHKTFKRAVEHIESGTWMWIKTGQSNEPDNFPMTVTKPMTISSWNGTAKIGY